MRLPSEIQHAVLVICTARCVNEYIIVNICSSVCGQFYLCFTYIQITYNFSAFLLITSVV